MSSWASAKLVNQWALRHSSRKRLLKLSMKAFWIGLPGSMNCSSTWCSIGPLIEDLTGQLWSVVEHDGLGRGAVVDELVEDPNDASARERGVDLDRQGFAGAGVQHRQRPNPPTGGQRVTDEVQTPAVIGLAAHARLDPATDGHPFPWSSAHRQPFLPIQPMNPFMVHPVPFSSQ